MSLQVSNQTTGRRTPQVYQGFGGAPGAGGAANNTPTASNGGGQTGTTGGGGGGPGSVGRPPKGNNKQSQIPVAVGGVGSHEVTLPPMAVVYPGAGGAIQGGTIVQPGMNVHRQFQMDHQYGTAVQVTPVATAAARKTTNGAGAQLQQHQQALVNTPVEKNVNSQKRNSTGGGEVAKVDPSVQPAVPVEVGKVRDSPRSSGRAQQQQKDELPVGKVSDQPQQKSKGGELMESSLLAEKSLKGFGPDGEEMESLLLEPWEFEDSPLPSRGTKSKIPKATPQAQARVSPLQATAKPDAKQTGDDAMEKNNPAKKPVEEEKKVDKKTTPKGGATEVSTPTTPTGAGTGDSPIGRPLRSISGRRSTRPISDIKFTHHRRSGDQHNDSFSSLNVTVGSDIGNDSLLMRTPGSASRKRKDMTPESTSDAPATDSPKRARLDFSGLFGMMSTPVTMLKNRLSRVKLQSPASAARSLSVEEEDTSKVVTAEATTTTANVTSPAVQEENKASESATTMEVDEAVKEKTDAGQTVVPEANATDDQGQQQQSSSSSATEDEVEVKIVTDKQQKQWCSIM